jgi:hypothetical protein
MIFTQNESDSVHEINSTIFTLNESDSIHEINSTIFTQNESDPIHKVNSRIFIQSESEMTKIANTNQSHKSYRNTNQRMGIHKRVNISEVGSGAME